MSIDVIAAIGTHEVRVEITNHGPAARGVELAVAVGGQHTFGHPPPSPSFQPSEKRVLGTAIQHVSETDPFGFVSCYDISGRTLHVWWPTGEHRTYRPPDSPADRLSRQELMQHQAPGFDRSQYTLVRHWPIES